MFEYSNPLFRVYIHTLEYMDNFWEWIKSCCTMDALIFYCVCMSTFNIVVKFLLYWQKDDIRQKIFNANSRAEVISEIKTDFDELLTDDYTYKVTTEDEDDGDDESLEQRVQLTKRILELRCDRNIDQDNDSELLLNMAIFSYVKEDFIAAKFYFRRLIVCPTLTSLLEDPKHRWAFAHCLLNTDGLIKLNESELIDILLSTPMTEDALFMYWNRLQKLVGKVYPNLEKAMKFLERQVPVTNNLMQLNSVKYLVHHVQSLVLLQRAYQKVERYNEALPLAKEAKYYQDKYDHIAKNPVTNGLNHDYANALIELKMTDESYEMLEEIVLSMEYEEQRKPYYVKVGKVRVSSYDGIKAIKTLQLGLAHAKGSERLLIWRYMAVANLQDNFCSKAVNLLDKIVKEATKFRYPEISLEFMTDVWSHKCNAEVKCSKFLEAEKSANICIKGFTKFQDNDKTFHKKEAYVNFSLSLISRKKHKYVKALEQLDAALKAYRRQDKSKIEDLEHNVLLFKLHIHQAGLLHFLGRKKAAKAVMEDYVKDIFGDADDSRDIIKIFHLNTQQMHNTFPQDAKLFFKKFPKLIKFKNQYLPSGFYEYYDAYQNSIRLNAFLAQKRAKIIKKY